MRHQILTFFIVLVISLYFLAISPTPDMALIINNAMRLGKEGIS